MPKEIFVTEEGLNALKEELELLKSFKRADIAEKIRVARSFGDLSENSEYDEAKNEQAQVEARILEIETTLKHVKIIDHDEITTDTIKLGTKVKLREKSTGDVVEYQIVGSTEADPLGGLISDESPVGKAILDHNVGDEVEVETPGGVAVYQVVEISK
ncbi:MAG: transcription elongation factor GreA [Oscillospiraceae bacterium]|jgi:transcription elongation factor GreA|nr:transcription elongation factor GreA [Oscillospiraceae bacterium]